MRELEHQLDFLELECQLDILELEKMMINNNDFTFEFSNGKEYRIINDNVIERIYFEEQEEQLEQVYPEIFKDKLWWVEIDIEKTIENILEVDGFGNLFATYDARDNEVWLEANNMFHFFRIN
jgi:secreted Zn-dependent insulinase-like peptidase